MKNVLVVSYSQSGQLDDIVAALARQLAEAGIKLHREALRPAPDFPFPWPFFAFLDAFPESVRLDPRRHLANREIRPIAGSRIRHKFMKVKQAHSEVAENRRAS